MSKPVFLDNTVLSNLALVERSDLVFQLWGKRVHTTCEVQREYQIAVRAGLLPTQAWRDLPVIDMTCQERDRAETFSKCLWTGERSCLAVAHARGEMVGTDDADARAVTDQLNIPLTGTLGILAVAVRRELLTLEEANALLAEMIVAGYRSPLEKLDTLV